ncbi:MAG: alpha/beta hydrolase fold protein [Solirubrobacteraceae bacterium]|nr:alpha/beta hydrolase fold protein [Solirubrobacteraceae bacterium]
MNPGLQTPPELDGVRHEWVDAGGLRTHVALAGPEDAPPLLLVHGWPQHWWAWREVIPELARSHRVICPDLRGHGWTDAPSSGYDKEQLATDLLALLDALAIEKVTWAGHDWGAFAGALAALRAPERFDRLVMMAIPPPFSRSRDPRTLLLLLGYQVPLSTPLFGRFISRHGFAGQILQRGRARGRFTDEEVRTFDDVFRARPHVSVAMYRTFLTCELVPLVRGRYADLRLEVPSTLLVGGKDLVTASVSAGPFPGQPKLAVEVVDGVGHFLPEEDPAAVLAVLRRR